MDKTTGFRFRAAAGAAIAVVLMAGTTRSDTAASTAGPGAAGPGAAASPGLLPMEDLQRLLDATAGRPASPPPEPATLDITVLTTAFPGVGTVGDPP